VLRRNLYLTNSSVPTNSPQLDFGDGRGYQTVSWNQPISTTYATAGLKRVKVKLPFIYSNGTQESWFDFNVLSIVAQARTTTTSDLIQNFTGSATHSGGKAYVIFGNTGGIKHTQLTKPFIISEGYNLYDIAPELRKCNNPNNNIEEFLDKINRNFLTPGAGNFRTNLLNAGYDIVYIDNAKGADDITRNAQLFEAVVRWVNLNKVGGTANGQKNVVMGQSMGGLVSRYGLAEMTKRGNDDPHTRLLVLHDSPQRGAYNPVGVQSLARSFDVPFLFGNSLADLDGQIRATVRVLNQPATQQLSILNAFDGRSTIQANTFIPNTYQPMIAFSGQPPYDIVAVSNGSQCGQPQNTPVGVTISQSSVALLLPIPYVGLAGITGDFGSYGLPAYGQQATVSRVSLRLEYQIRIGLCPFCVAIPIRFSLLREAATSPPNTLPYETLPGGSTNPYQQAGGCADGFDFGSLNGIYAAYFRTNLYNGDLCFVPSYSALDVPTVTPSTAFSKYVNNFTSSPSLPQVNRYVAQEQANGTLFNTTHISFTPRNSEWIYNEMQRPFNGNTNPLPCATECSISQQMQLTGPEFQCPGSRSTYTLTGVPAGYTVAWSNTVGGTAVTVNGMSYSLTIPSSRTTNGQVTAMLSSPCDNRSLTAPVRVLPQLSFVRSNPSSTQCAVLALATSYGFDNVHWVIDGVEDTTTPVVTGQETQFEVPNGGSLRLALRGTNRCTGQRITTASRSYSIGAGCLNRTASSTVTLYPNPAREFVQVEVENGNPDQLITVRLYDAKGTLRLEATSVGQQPLTLRLKTDKLPTGLYLVHVLQSEQVLSRQQLQIE
jgi:hypothetical protein